MQVVKQNDYPSCWMDTPLSTNLCQNQYMWHKVSNNEDICQVEIWSLIYATLTSQHCQDMIYTG